MKEIRPIRIDQALPLRTAILRPNRPQIPLRFPGDHLPETFHVGVFVNRELAGVATALHESPEGLKKAGAWRIRGVAIEEGDQRKGYGSDLIRACIAYVRTQEGTRLWCNARTYAVPFYESLGFETRGEEFLLQGVGPHYQMWYCLEAEEPRRLERK
jgi:predicted GNAT family N-acyltransferase